MSGKPTADVVILGCGPAGAAAAITLARLGASVLIVDRSAQGPTLGEGLPPSAMPLLEQLGLRDRFLAGGHQPSYGNRSLWGTSCVEEYDFIRSPYGAGWHLDRPRFDAMLAAALEDLGVSVYRRSRILACRRDTAGAWTLCLRPSHPPTPAPGDGVWEVRTPFLVDATGRARWLARAQGTRRRVYDRLVGVVAVFPPTSEVECDSFTLVEAARQGWWYSTRLPDGRLAVGYMTDADIAAAARAKTVAEWSALLAQTEQTRDRLARHGHDKLRPIVDGHLGGYHLECPPSLVCADSSCLEAVAGEGWCAVGDAATAYDPLSSQGIMSALTSGVWAGHAIATGNLAAFERQMQHLFAHYLANRMAYYAMEQRWPSSPFWRRRHLSASAALLTKTSSSSHDPIMPAPYAGIVT